MLMLKKLTLGVLLAFLVSGQAIASKFQVGETVFVAFPAGNIKDDAFIVGKINKVMADGDYLISVLDYVEGHDYGVSCVPMTKYDTVEGANSALSEAWQLWDDTTKLEPEELDYVVPKERVLKLGYGKNYFIERNNLYIVFGRWLSDAPMLNIDRIDRAIKQAKSNNLEGMTPAFELAKMQRRSFYGENGRPLYAFETIAPMVKAMDFIDQLFIEKPELKALWFARPRNWEVISANAETYFMVNAIDKIVDDAWNQIYEEGLDKADPTDLARLKDYVAKYKR